MRPIITILLLLLTVTLPAQITLTRTNVPAPGDTLFYARDTSTANISIGAMGTGQLWDFSQLQVEETYQLIARDTVGDPNAHIYPGANLIISTEGLNTYLESTDTAVYLLGGGLPEAAVFGLDGIVFSAPQKLYEFPSTYGTTFTTHFSVDATVDGSIFFQGVDSVRLIRRSTAQVMIDGYGTVKTPYNSYDALRQRTETLNADSIFILYFGSWTPFTVDTSMSIEYQWLTAEAKGNVATAYMDEASGLVESVEFFLDVQNANAPIASFSFEDQGEGTVAFLDQSGNEPVSWQWTFGDGASSSEQNPTHTYAISGNYQVCLTVGNSVGNNQLCQQITVDIVNSLPDPDKRMEMEVYPNPTRDFIHFLPKGLEQQRFQLTLFDARGQKLRQADFTGQLRLNVEALPPGFYTYFLQTTTDYQWSSGKILVIP